eukprot:388879-Pyramimonas_sp.AAC.1
MAREGQMRQWSSDSAPHWDAAVAGNSALREAFLRGLNSEVFSRMGVAHGEALLDVASFYDSIEFEVLADTAARLSFPP